MRMTLESLKERLLGPQDSQIRISMLGPSGVGKTSLLATMYDQLEHVVRGADLQLSPRADDAHILDRKITDLQLLFATDGLKPDVSAGIAGTADARTFEFGLGRRAKTPIVQLEFVDYPGGYIEGAHREAREWVITLLRESDVVLIPIDAPALMERDMYWHRDRNRPEFIYNLLQEAYRELSTPRLVVLCPIRCERYLRKPEYQDVMLRQVRTGYQRLLAHLECSALQDNVAVVVAPVQTLGEMVFAGSLPDRYLPVFEKTHADAKYCPVDSEQPLRYVLRFAMRLHQADRDRGFLVKFRNLFRADPALAAATAAFASGCKMDAPFAVLQGHDWLTLRARS